jgi:hypothetical protein
MMNESEKCDHDWEKDDIVDREKSSLIRAMHNQAYRTS